MAAKWNTPKTGGGNEGTGEEGRKGWGGGRKGWGGGRKGWGGGKEGREEVGRGREKVPNISSI